MAARWMIGRGVVGRGSVEAAVDGIAGAPHGRSSRVDTGPVQATRVRVRGGLGGG